MAALTPAPINPEYAIDKEGRLYQHTVIQRENGDLIDIGYAIAQKERE